MSLTDEELRMYEEYEGLKREYFDTAETTARIILESYSHLTQESRKRILIEFMDNVTGVRRDAMGPGILYDLKQEVESDPTVEEANENI
jgi:hypothetical protein